MSPKTIVRTNPINRQSPKSSAYTISITRPPLTLPAWTALINRQLRDSAVEVIVHL